MGGATVIKGTEADKLVRAFCLMPWSPTLKGTIVKSECPRLSGSHQLCWCNVVFVTQRAVVRLGRALSPGVAELVASSSSGWPEFLAFISRGSERVGRAQPLLASSHCFSFPSLYFWEESSGRSSELLLLLYLIIHSSPSISDLSFVIPLELFLPRCHLLAH